MMVWWTLDKSVILLLLLVLILVLVDDGMVA